MVSLDAVRARAVSRIIAHRATNGISVCSPNPASYCNARSRILTSVFSTLATRTAEELPTRTGETNLFRRMYETLKPGDVVLAGALFDDYFIACEFGIDLVARAQYERTGSWPADRRFA